MNFTMAMRQSLLNAFLGNFVFYLPMVILGVHPGVVMFMLAINLSYQYFVHTNMIGKLPAWFEYVFNTPSHHRVHHGKNPQYIDRNYGGVSCCFRWLIWFTPLWIWASLPAAEMLSRRGWGRWLLGLLVVGGAFSAATALQSPWRHPWIYRYFEFLGWIGG
jgi:hypothetical protein